MKKYSFEWCEELMTKRGYRPHGSFQSNRWIKDVGDITTEDYFPVFAHIRTKEHSEGIQLSSNPMKMMMTIQSPYIQIDHPNFIDFENKLIKYIDSCMSVDYVEEAVKLRQTERNNRRRSFDGRDNQTI